MPPRLERRQQTGDYHFITTSCHAKRAHLASAQASSIFEHALEAHRTRYCFNILGYVVMPTHVHLLISEPETHPLSTVIGALKRSVSKQLQEAPFWMARYHDRNIYSEEERIEKLRYMHRNPVAWGLAANPLDYPWSSFGAYFKRVQGTVSIRTELCCRS